MQPIELWWFLCNELSLCPYNAKKNKITRTCKYNLKFKIINLHIF